MAYTIRFMEPRDVPAVQKLHDEQNRRDGTNYPLTQVFNEFFDVMPNVAMALVICDGDEVKQGVVFERGCEMLLSGCDPKATATLHKKIGRCFDYLRRKHYPVVHCFIPKQVVLPTEKPLKDVGFVRDDFRLAHFLKDLTLVERNEETESEAPRE